MLINNPPLSIEPFLKIDFEGMPLKFAVPIYRDINRYFLPLSEFINQIGGKVNMEEGKLNILFNGKSRITINYDVDAYKFSIIDSVFHIALFDLCKILDLKTLWDYNRSSISLYWNRAKGQYKSFVLGRTALIRFEDVTASEVYLSSNNLEKFRTVADYMFSAGVPFHIAWIPRFIDPPNHIDNDISRDYSMPNANFLFTIEYLLSKNGIIGLHGYTHQYGNEVSADGTEFNEERNNDENSARKRVEAAIKAANKLELPFKFFESPHLAATAFQQSIFEQYFDIIYECFVGIWGEKIVKSPRNQRTLYVPTPLGYVEGEDGTEQMLHRINTLQEGTLASLFFHPTIDFEYITLRNDSTGYPLSSYSENSPLHQIVNALYEKGCSYTKITDLSYDSSLKNKHLGASFLNNLINLVKGMLKLKE